MLLVRRERLCLVLTVAPLLILFSKSLSVFGDNVDLLEDRTLAILFRRKHILKEMNESGRGANTYLNKFAPCTAVALSDLWSGSDVVVCSANILR